MSSGFKRAPRRDIDPGAAQVFIQAGVRSQGGTSPAAVSQDPAGSTNPVAISPSPQAAPKGGRPSAYASAPTRLTVYLSGDTAEELEHVRLRLRDLVPKEERSKVTKSLVIDLALKVGIEDLRANPEQSGLARMLRALFK